jgi:hypothetical protein
MGWERFYTFKELFKNKPGMVVYAYNPSTWEIEAGGFHVWGQPGLHSETLSQKNQNWETIKIILDREHVAHKALDISCLL